MRQLDNVHVEIQSKHLRACHASRNLECPLESAVTEAVEIGTGEKISKICWNSDDLGIRLEGMDGAYVAILPENILSSDVSFQRDDGWFIRIGKAWWALMIRLAEDSADPSKYPLAHPLYRGFGPMPQPTGEPQRELVEQISQWAYSGGTMPEGVRNIWKLAGEVKPRTHEWAVIGKHWGFECSCKSCNPNGKWFLADMGYNER